MDISMWLILFLLILLLVFILIAYRMLQKMSLKAELLTKPDTTEVLLQRLSENLAAQLGLLNQTVNAQNADSRQKLDYVGGAVGKQLQQLRQENLTNLQTLQTTVNDKLDERLVKSFSEVSLRLQEVYQGLGQMQSLAANVGQLEKLLRNVKIRGTWGEVQLGGILGQILSAGQYEANVHPDPKSDQVVEYAVKLPQGEGSYLWLPIDAKCPIEDYQRLIEAEEIGDLTAKSKAAQALQNRIKACGKSIAEKYIKPPFTTDFAILFLPLEGLFNEAITDQALCDCLQNEHRVLLAGPTTLAALLNVVQTAHRSIAIQERTDEVWKILSEVKAEFDKYDELLSKCRKKLQETDSALEKLEVRERVLKRKLAMTTEDK